MKITKIKNLKSILYKSIPFVIGLLLGAGLTKNKYVWLILICYILIVIIFRAVAAKLMKFKGEVDKKIAIEKAGKQSLNDAIDYIGFTFVHLWSNFDKFYPVYVFFMGVTCLIATIIFLCYKQWVLAIVVFTLMNLFTILNQIIRMIKEIKLELKRKIK